MKYFGKRYLHNFLTAQGFNPPKLKEMEYGKCRGDEWLRCDSLDLFCIFGHKINVSVLEYDDSTDKSHETERYGYKLVGGEWKLEYKRIGRLIVVSRRLTSND